MTSLRSEYRSGDDEQEIFNLILRTDHPQSDDESVSNQEEEHLSSEDYGDQQDEFDENEARIRNLADFFPQLPEEARDRIIGLLDDILPQ